MRTVLLLTVVTFSILGGNMAEPMDTDDGLLHEEAASPHVADDHLLHEVSTHPAANPAVIPLPQSPV